MNDNVELVTLLVEVHRKPGVPRDDAWKPTPRHVAAELQYLLGRFETDDGYHYGSVQCWPSDTEADPTMLATEGGVIVDLMIRYSLSVSQRHAPWEEIVRRVRAITPPPTVVKDYG